MRDNMPVRDTGLTATEHPGTHTGTTFADTFPQITRRHTGASTETTRQSPPEESVPNIENPSASFWRTTTISQQDREHRD